MKTANFTLELITPCFCAGADQSKAEIRAPAIRGQLRWWFRTLGGFKFLATAPLREQEALIFGSAAGDEGSASPLTIRVTQPQTQSVEKNGDSPEANIRSATGYILFPLRNKTRGAIEAGSFDLKITWRGELALWPNIRHLVTVFAHLGSLGFRSRRGYGALAPIPSNPLDLKIALSAFNQAAQAISIRSLPPTTAALPALANLANWLKGWRSHGRSSVDLIDGKPRNLANMPGFKYAKADHDAGYGMNRNGQTYRAALGLPIIQRCDRTTNNWEFEAGRDKGRFASPVLLRPHRTAGGQIRPLILFLHAHRWPAGHQVYLNGQPRTVSLDLYEAMQLDRNLQPFNP